MIIRIRELSDDPSRHILCFIGGPQVSEVILKLKFTKSYVDFASLFVEKWIQLQEKQDNLKIRLAERPQKSPCRYPQGLFRF
ncbi:hypothetical protein J2X69_001566 [Algoriphagus sp. 4150]|nr:hypothetical protein [Algoriphagus sp. 4150]